LRIAIGPLGELAVKVTLDLSTLLQDGAITPEEYDRLVRLGRQDTGRSLIDVLIGFGVIAVSGGALALLPTVLTGIILGGVLMATGIGLFLSRRPQWSVLANICVLVAALLLGSGIILLSQGIARFDANPGLDRSAAMSLPVACLIVTTLLAASAALARSSLLAALAVLMLCNVPGGDEFYEHAANALTRPLATVVLFASLALAAYLASRTVRNEWQHLASTVARTAIFLVNLGFFSGSLWGDDLSGLHVSPGTAIPPAAFAVGWAVALFGVAFWAGRAGRRWLLNLAAAFGGIHFCVQWFAHLGATPVSVLTAGVIVLVFAMILWQINRRAGVQLSPSRAFLF
jgi:iron complex transport system permease protein